MDAVLDLTRYSVRDGRLAPVTCVACGCRLEQRSGQDGWYHFSAHEGRDARGCIVECAERAHYRSGAILAEAS
jgi:competence CoiA-like predicted nuclease